MMPWREAYCPVTIEARLGEQSGVVWKRVGEARALVRQPVDVRRLHVGMTRRAGLVEAQVIHQDDDEIGLFLVLRGDSGHFLMAQSLAMTPRAITIRPAEPRDAQAIATMSRDFIESGLGWKYDAARVLRAMRDRETLAVVACEGAKGAASSARSAIAGFAIMEFGDERAHLVLLAVRPSHRRLGIGQRMLDWLLDSARVAGMASIHLELRAGNDAARRFYRAMGFYETVLVPGYYRSGEGRKEGALRMLRGPALARARRDRVHLEGALRARSENDTFLGHDREADAELGPALHVVVEDVLAVAVEVLRTGSRSRRRT